MQLVPLDPDPKLRRLAHGVALAGVILLAAVTLPLFRLQLGPLGWRILQDALGEAFWPLTGLGAAGAALLLAYTLWLRNRPALAPLLLILPATVALTGVIIGLGRLPTSGPGGPLGLVAAADSLATPAYAFALAASLAAAGALVLGALTLRRARVLHAPWGGMTPPLWFPLGPTWTTRSPACQLRPSRWWGSARR